MNEDKINMDEWRFMLAGGSTVPADVPNPASDWLSERAWKEVLMLSNLTTFSELAEDFKNNLDGFKRIFDSAEPHRYCF